MADLNDILSIEDEDLEEQLTNTLDKVFDIEKEEEEDKNTEEPVDVNSTFNEDSILPIQADVTQYTSKRVQDSTFKEKSEQQAQREALIRETADKYSFMDRYQAGRELFHVDQIEAQSNFRYNVDNLFNSEEEDFVITPELKEELVSEFPPEQLKDILESETKGEFEFRKERANNFLENMEILSSNGFGSSVGHSLLAGVTDPTMLGVSFATSGYAVPAQLAKTASNAVRLSAYVKRGAVIGGAEGAGYGAVNQFFNPYSKFEDLLYHTAGGIVGGSAGGALGYKLTKQIDKSGLDRNGLVVTRKGDAEFESTKPYTMIDDSLGGGELNKTSRVSSETIEMWLDNADGTFKTSKNDVDLLPSKKGNTAGFPPNEWFNTPVSKNFMGSLDTITSALKFKTLNNTDKANLLTKILGRGYHTNKDTAYLLDGLQVNNNNLDEIFEKLFSTKSIGELEARSAILALRNLTSRANPYQQAVTSKQLQKINSMFDNNKFDDVKWEKFKLHEAWKKDLRHVKIDGVKYTVKRSDADFDNGMFAVTNGKKYHYLMLQKDGWYRASKEGKALSKLTDDARNSGNAPWDSIRVLYKHDGKTKEEALTKQAEQDLLLFNKTEAALRERGESFDPEDVPVMHTHRQLLSAISRAGASESPLTRRLIFKLGLVSSGYKTKDSSMYPVQKAASQLFDHYNTGNTAQWGQINKKYRLGRWRKWEGLTPDEVETNNFFIMQGQETPYPVTDAQLNLAADRRNLYDSIFREAESRDVVDLPQYIENWMPRQYHPSKSLVALNTYDHDSLKRAFGLAVRAKMTQGLKPNSARAKELNALAAKTGAAYLRGIEIKVVESPRNAGSSPFVAPKMSKETIEEMLEAAAEENPKSFSFTAKEKESIAELLGSSGNKDKSKNIHSRSRMDIDVFGTYRVKLKGSNEYQSFKISDMLETNSEGLFLKYNHRMSGATALARVGIDTDESFESMLTAATKEQSTLGIPADVGRAELEAVRNLYRMIRGSFDPNHGQVSNNTAISLERLRGVTFALQMGSAGVAAMIETSNIAFENGVHRFLMSQPYMATLFLRGANGKLKDDVLAEFEDFEGTGSDLLTGTFVSRYEELELVELIRKDYGLTDKVLNEIKRAVSIWGGLQPVTIWLSRTNKRVAVQNFYDNLVKKNKLDFYSKARFAQLGLTKDKLLAIQKQMKLHSKVHAKGARGRLGYVEKVGINEWTDRIAADDFKYALSVDVRQSVQKSDLASNNAFQKSAIGKTIFQLKNFPLAATEQQFARHYFRLTNNDYRPIAIILGAMAIAAYGYVAKVYQAAEGRSEKEKERYLKEQLKPERIAYVTATSQGSLGWLSMFRAEDPASLAEAPAFMIPKGVYDIGKAAYDGVNPEENLTEGEARKALFWLFGNIGYLKPLKNTVAQELAETDD